MKPFDVTCYSDEAEDVTMVRKAVYLDEVEKAIAALKEQNAQLQQSLADALLQVPEGWKLVPVEPTADMIIAAGDGYETGEVIGPASCYRVMIAAAPALPPQPSLTERQTDEQNRV